MNFPIELCLSIFAWSLTLVRFKSIHWRDVGKDNVIALHVWLSMMFFSITSIFLIKKFCDFFDSHTFDNLDRLIAYSSILVGITFAAIASIEAVGKPSDLKLIYWLQYALIMAILALTAIYSRYLTRIPDMDYLIPRSLPEMMFMFIAFSYGAFLCFMVGRVYFAYLPSETSSIMRTRARLIILNAFITFAYFLIKITTVGGYLWPILASDLLINLSSILLIVAALTYFSALLSNKMYVHIVVISRNIQSWRAFKDLRYLMVRILRLCPDITSPAINPSFLEFVINPDYYLYSTIITIMDGKAMLDDLLSEGALHGEPALWGEYTSRDVVQIRRALQSIHPSDDFLEIVREYALASKRLILNQYSKPSIGK